MLLCFSNIVGAPGLPHPKVYAYGCTTQNATPTGYVSIIIMNATHKLQILIVPLSGRVGDQGVTDLGLMHCALISMLHQLFGNRRVEVGSSYPAQHA